jgi:hypothetical protein
MKSKKGIALSQAFGAVLALVLVAVLVIIAIFLFYTLSGTFPNRSLTTLNEAGASISTSGYLLVNANACQFNDPVIATARNTTDGSLISSGNYTVSGTGILNKTATGTVYDTVTLNYTYNDKGEACIASNNMVTNFSQYPTLVGLVGTIIFLGIVIGVLVASFVFGGKGQV